MSRTAAGNLFNCINCQKKWYLPQKITEVPELKEHTFDYQGLPVSYRVTGSGPPLLMIHGWGSSARVMLPLARSLSDIRTCYVPDLPGFGETPAPKAPWTIGDYAGLARTFTKEVIGGPVDVLAHSFGGRMVLKWASDSARGKGTGDKSGMISASGHTKPGPDHHTDGNAADSVPGSELRKIIITGGAGMKPRRSFSYYRRRVTAMILKAPFVLLPGALRLKAMDWLRGTSVWKSLGSSDYQKLEGVMRETFVKTVSEHLENCLPDISQEVLLLWGKEDEATPWYQAERMEKGLANGALVGLERAGHYAFLDQPDHFQRIVRAFLVAE
ncbi:MAG: alpha/beta hydrolase [Balneolaceae bacterium]|nr:MAG: alpha/beta hydrolase [Balneolaceae bacterium]